MAFCSSGWERKKKDFAVGVCDFSRVGLACCWTLEKNYGECMQPWKKKKKSCSTGKHEETSNCFPGVCDPLTPDDLPFLLLQIKQHSLLILWHILSCNTLLWVDQRVSLVWFAAALEVTLSKNGINNQKWKHLMGLKLERQWPIQCVNIRLMEDTPT